METCRAVEAIQDDQATSTAAEVEAAATRLSGVRRPMKERAAAQASVSTGRWQTAGDALRQPPGRVDVPVQREVASARLDRSATEIEDSAIRTRLLRRMQNLCGRNSARNMQGIGAVGQQQASHIRLMMEEAERWLNLWSTLYVIRNRATGDEGETVDQRTPLLDEREELEALSVDGGASTSRQEDRSKANEVEEAVSEPIVADWAGEVGVTRGDGTQQKKVE
ncbi:unnamed protein product [Lampetra planeri]